MAGSDGSSSMSEGTARLGSMAALSVLGVNETATDEGDCSWLKGPVGLVSSVPSVAGRALRCGGAELGVELGALDIQLAQGFALGVMLGLLGRRTYSNAQGKG